MSRRTGCEYRFRSLRDDPTQVIGRAGCSPSIYHGIRILLWFVNAPPATATWLGPCAEASVVQSQRKRARRLSRARTDASPSFEKPTDAAPLRPGSTA